MTLKSNLETYRRLGRHRTLGVWNVQLEGSLWSVRADDTILVVEQEEGISYQIMEDGSQEPNDLNLMAASPSILSDLERAVGLIEEMKKQIDSALGNTKDEIRRQFDMEPPQDIDGPVCCITVLLAEEHLMGALTHYKSVMGD